MTSIQPIAEFGTLPDRKAARNVSPAWQKVADTPREHSGEWAMVLNNEARLKSVASYATNIRRGHLLAFRPAGAFESVMRDGNIWARHVGDPS